MEPSDKFYINYTTEGRDGSHFYQMGPYIKRDRALRHMDELRRNKETNNVYLTHDRCHYRDLVEPL